jgi:coproporphyrinogen III oxidase-like Fe-S oxidoreductase
MEGQTPVAQCDALTPWQWAVERLAFGLRRCQGVNVEEIARDAGVDLAASIEPLLRQWQSLGLVEAHPGHFRLTPHGREISDAILGEILSRTPQLSK